GRAGNGVSGVGVSVEELDCVRRTGHECVVNVLPRDDAAEGNHTVGHGFGERNEVGCHSEALCAEVLSDTTKARDDFIEYEQYAVARTDVAESVQVAVRRNDYAGGALHGLYYHRRDGVCPMLLDEFAELVSEMRAPGGLSFAEAHFSGVIGMREMVDVRHHQRCEHRAVVRDTTDGRTTDSNSMVAAFAADDSRALYIAPNAVVRDGDLQCRVDGLGAGVREKYAIQTRRCPACDACRELEGAGMAYLKSRGIVQGRHLALDRFHDLRMAVT